MQKMRPEERGNQVIGIGSTSELNLRVSVATLSRVVFPHPQDNTPMLALEHKATLQTHGEDSQIIVMAQPFGGAIRINDTHRLQQILGSFNFDSENSQSEQDFRIYIEASNWQNVRDFCLQQMRLESSAILDLYPARELIEEFDDALGIQINPEQYTIKAIGIVLENAPVPTSNMRAVGDPTVRIYQIHEVQIQDSSVCNMMIDNSRTNTPQALRKLAQADAHQGGRGRANAVLVTPVEQVYKNLLATPYKKRNEPLQFDDTFLDKNVSAIIDGISLPDYKKL